jgi:Replication initiator protein A/DnaA N-terminal domain
LLFKRLVVKQQKEKTDSKADTGRTYVGASKRTAKHYPALVQVESNIEEFPIFQLGKSPKSGTIVWERTIESNHGASLRQRMEVSSGKYKLPGRFDYDVYLAVLELLERRGGMPESGTLEFSVGELVSILGLERGGRTDHEVKESLKRIALTGIESENAFWSNGARRYISDTFRLWDVHFDQVERPTGVKSRHQIEFGKLFVRSFEEQYLRGLDTGFYWELSSPLAKRLYRLIDHKRSGAPCWKTNLFELQKQIPLANYPYASRIRNKLQPAHEELLDASFLSDVAYTESNLVLYTVAEEFRTSREGLELAGTREELIAIQLLTASSMRGDVARDLVARYGAERCTFYANALPHQKNLRSPAGWLRRAIEEGYELDVPPTARSETSKDASLKAKDADLSGQEEQALPVADPRAEEVWHLVLRELSQKLDSPSLQVWFEGIVPAACEGSTLTLHVPNEFALEYIEERFGGLMRRILREQQGADADVEIRV